MTLSAHARKIEEHYTSIWSAPSESVRWERGPVDDLPADFRVLTIRRTADMNAYATRCMSQPNDHEPIEIHAFRRFGDEVGGGHVVEALTVIAHFHRTSVNLGCGHTVNLGRPWIPGSSCSHGLLSLPYLDGPVLEWSASPRVRFLWLVPVTEAEVAFKRGHGLDALESRFEEAGFDYLDPFRPSVV